MRQTMLAFFIPHDHKAIDLPLTKNRLIPDKKDSLAFYKMKV